MARELYPFFPGTSLLLWRQFDTGRALPSIRAPILIVHCAGDPVVPPEMAEKVFEAARPPKSILREGFCHEEASLVGREKYQEALKSFLKELDKSLGEFSER